MQESVAHHSSDSKIEVLKSILNSLEKGLEMVSDDIVTSHLLLDSGAKSQLIAEIEKTLDNPVESMVSISDKIDESIKNIFHHFVIGYLKHNKEIVSAVYKSKTSLNNLHYSIVLTEDNFDNRDKIFDFFNTFPLVDFTNKYPILFQITPPELVEKIYSKEEVKLDD